VESEDQVTWTVTLEEGWTFHDGTPVTAESFVDAWNWTACSPNAQAASYFFGNVEATATCRPPWTTRVSRPATPSPPR
jgi:oligopeptide transport system substrate-binding protein